MAWWLSLVGGVGVVLGMVSLVGCPCWESVVVIFYTAVFRVHEAPPPCDVGAFSRFLGLLHTRD